MRTLRAGALAALSLFLPTLAAAQALTPLPGLISNGTPPPSSNLVVQNMEFFCTAANALCWPQMQLWDGTTRVMVNANGGLNVNVVAGLMKLTNDSVSPVVTSPSNAASTLVNWGSAGPVTVVGQINAIASIPISISSATTTQLVAPIAGQSIYVTSALLVAAAADTVTFKYGTGANCGTGTQSLTGAMPFIANFPFGGQFQLFVPAGNALCVTTSAAVVLAGTLAYLQQ